MNEITEGNSEEISRESGSKNLYFMHERQPCADRAIVSLPYNKEASVPADKCIMS